MTLLEFLNRIKLTVRGPKYKKASEQALQKNQATILQALRSHSPVDSGYFRSRWRVHLTKFSGSSTELAGMLISNDTEHYGQFMEEGAEPFKAPWYFPHKHKFATGKLTYLDGKVWAGGLNPGHAKTFGGAINKVFSERSKILEKLTIDVSDSAIKAFL